MKRIQKIEKSLDKIQAAQPDTAFLKRLEANLLAHKKEIKRVSIAATLVAAASLTLLFTANLYVLNIPENGQTEQLSKRDMVEEYNLYPTTFKTFGDE